MPNEPTAEPDLAHAKSAKSRRLRYVLAALALAVILLWLAVPMLSSKIIPPPASPETADVALVITEGQTWLVLPRPDGSTVAFTFAPQSSPASPWDKGVALVSAQPAALLKAEVSNTASVSAAAMEMHAQETWVVQAPLIKTFQLTARLDALYAQNIASLTSSSNTAVRQVAVSERYSPVIFNTNQWAALQLSELGIRVEGTGILTRWSIEPATP
jgi:hypothetical protein